MKYRLEPEAYEQERTALKKYFRAQDRMKKLEEKKRLYARKKVQNKAVFSAIEKP